MEIIKESTTGQSSPYRLWAFVLFGAAFGLTYGMVTMSGEVTSGCMRNPEGFCGFVGGLLNLPATYISAVFVPRDNLHTAPIQLSSILILDAIFGAAIGYFASKKFKKKSSIKFGITLFIVTLILIAPLFLFFAFVR